MKMSFGLRAIAAITLAAGCSTTAVRAQGAPPAQQPSPVPRAAIQADLDGRTAEARRILQAALDTTTAPAARAAIQRAIAMSYAFDGDCANTLRYEEMVIAYWVTREQAEPQNAFYQQGEMANEGARVCIDAGNLDEAERWYRRGSELGNREPEPRTHPRSLWDYRLAHARARLAARRGDAAEAGRQVAEARRILASDTAMAAQQARFLPYLAGYVALYTNDLATAERELTAAVAMRGNDRDPFMRTLLAMVYERQGRQDQAMATYRQAYEMATNHNPPAAFARPNARRMLGL